MPAPKWLAYKEDAVLIPAIRLLAYVKIRYSHQRLHLGPFRG
jgi:hypothetical protein